MKRHSLSILVSLLLHTILLVLLFLSYKYIYPKFSTPKETRVCIKLNCIAPSHTEEVTTPKKVPAVKKTVEKKKIKKEKIEKKKVRAVKKVPVKKTPVTLVFEQKLEPKKKEKVQEKAKAEIVVKPVIVKEKKSISQNTVEILLPQESEKTDEEVYVEENLNLIVQLLQENLYYPRRARKRGVEGDVLVRFKLSKNAEISGLEVLSSKSDILSRGALKTIENIASQLPKPKENLTLSVPISYRLN